MLGVEVDDRHLPTKEHGNIFLNPLGISYAYSVSHTPASCWKYCEAMDSKESVREHLKSFRKLSVRDIEAAMARRQPQAANYRIVPRSSVKLNVALLGDARGCCHPLTASGITTAVKDVEPVDALVAHNLNVEKALKDYSIAAGRIQLTRRTLSEELREAFLSHTRNLFSSIAAFSNIGKATQKGGPTLWLCSTMDRHCFHGDAVRRGGHAGFPPSPSEIRSGATLAWFKSIMKLGLKSPSIPQTALQHWIQEQSLTK